MKSLMRFFGLLGILVRAVVPGSQGSACRANNAVYPSDGNPFLGNVQITASDHGLVESISRGGGILPAGYNPFGYQITVLGEQFLEFGGCLDTDIGRFLASIKKRKSMSVIQTQWLEIVRVSKSGQSMRIYRTLQQIIDFCLAARLID